MLDKIKYIINETNGIEWLILKNEVADGNNAYNHIKTSLENGWSISLYIENDIHMIEVGYLEDGFVNFIERRNSRKALEVINSAKNYDKEYSI